MTNKGKKSNKDQSLQWQFDAHTFQLIGRELITDRVTAVFELVKNTYDANSKKVTVRFHNVKGEEVKQKKGKKGKKLLVTKVKKPKSDAMITIEDDGCGMNLVDMKNKWMLVGTPSKRESKCSPEPYSRVYIGEKGIGRFAVDKLGGYTEISTLKIGHKKRYKLTIDWNQYEELSKKNERVLFTEIKNYYSVDNADKFEPPGTKIEISSVRDIWEEKDLLRLEKELEKIVSPFFKLDPPFNIVIQSNEFKKYKNKEVKASTIQFSSHEYHLDFDLEKNEQDRLIYDEEKRKISIEKVPIKNFGPVEIKLYYFDEQAKQKYNKFYKNDDVRIDGFKIYRDGIITTPFAEFESDRNKKRDILGVDKRLWSGAFDKIGSREIIGIVNISKANNPSIVESTNRQDFIDNEEYRQFKSFLIEQLVILEELKIKKRKEVAKETNIKLESANATLNEFKSLITNLEKSDPKFKPNAIQIKKKITQISTAVKKGIKQQKQERKEHTRKENIYLSLMSLQDYATQISHLVRTSIGKIKRQAEFISKHFPAPEFDELFLQYSKDILNEMNSLNRIIDFMLSYAASNLEVEEFNVKYLLEDIFNNKYSLVFKKENIETKIQVQDSFTVSSNKKFFEDIFENLIANSLKALKNTKEKKISCTAYIEDNSFIIIVSDNGIGINPGEELRIFDIYFTNTADEGGSGMGLYIVKTRIESLNGKIEVTDSEYDCGATFKISLPLVNDE